MRRKKSSLIILFTLALAVSFAVCGTVASADSQSKIAYHNGPVITGDAHLYFIWYGDWSPGKPGSNQVTQNVVTGLVSEIGPRSFVPTPYFKINTTYPNLSGVAPSGVLTFGGSINDASYRHGRDLTAFDIQQIVFDQFADETLPFDPAGIYIVVGAYDVASGATGFCSTNNAPAPPHHGHFGFNQSDVRYAFIGNPTRCPAQAAPQFVALNGSLLPTPNGDFAGDAMASTLAHVLDVVVTNPQGDAWFDPEGRENAVKCKNTFGLTYTLENGAQANMKFGQRDYLIQQNWVNDGPGYCGLKIDNRPVTDDKFVVTDEDNTVRFTLWAEDIDDDPMTFRIITQPQHGTLMALMTTKNATFTYTPSPNFNGTDSFTFKVDDGKLETATATATIKVNPVNDAPVAADDSYTIPENTGLGVGQGSGLLRNDKDVDGNTLSVVLVSGPSHASSFVLNKDGSFSYRPVTNFSGTDTFTYKANDGTLDSNTATVTMTINDGGTLHFNADNYTVSEDGVSAAVTIKRTGGGAGMASVLFSTSNGTASASDYKAVSQTVTFAEGETSKTVNVPITDDAVNEADETVNLTLSQPSGSGQLGTPVTAQLTIKDNDVQLPSITVEDVSVAEGGAGAGVNAVLTVKLSAASSVTVKVDYATSDGTARAGNDYAATSGTLTFAPGETEKTVTVLVQGDTQNEPSETFFVNLSNAQNATISDSQAVAEIVNDDSPTIQFFTGSYQINEAANNTPQGFTSLTVDVIRTGDLSNPATVKYLTSDQSGGNECEQVTGFASQRCDYTLAAGTLRFAAGEAGQTISIPIINDGYKEGDEFFNIQLQGAVGAALGTTAQSTITIRDDDAAATTGAHNPYLSNSFFVRQNYLDFLVREPDANGFTDWLNSLNNCGPQKGFLGAPPECDRAQVSHGFFGSLEFTDTGFLIYRLYEVGAGRLPRYNEFVPDMAALSGFGLSDSVKQQNLSDYLEQFTAKPEFTVRFGVALQPSQAAMLIQKLEQAIGVTLPSTATTNPGQPQQYARQQLIDLRASGTLTVGQTLKAFVEQQPVYDRYFTSGEVTMMYFAYLRRDPDLNDPNLLGWKDWVDVFTNGRPSAGVAQRDIHHLIFGFIYSEEYRKRFGAP
ncbi:MAG: tandem-95 repeat protein [Pyrinomonadaceae bacterium]|nr:tandem-95 repeat protein [Pyrinomonadaceae bacterium]